MAVAALAVVKMTVGPVNEAHDPRCTNAPELNRFSCEIRSTKAVHAPNLVTLVR